MSVSGPVDVMVPFEVVATATAVALLLLMPQLLELLLEVPLTLVPMPLLLLLLLELLLLELLDEVPHSGAGEEVALLLQLVGIGLLVGFGEVSSPLRLARLVARAEIRRLRSSRRSDLSGDTCGREKGMRLDCRWVS